MHVKKARCGQGVRIDDLPLTRRLKRRIDNRRQATVYVVTFIVKSKVHRVDRILYRAAARHDIECTAVGTACKRKHTLRMCGAVILFGDGKRSIVKKKRGIREPLRDGGEKANDLFNGSRLLRLEILDRLFDQIDGSHSPCGNDVFTGHVGQRIAAKKAVKALKQELVIRKIKLAFRQVLKFKIRMHTGPKRYFGHNKRRQHVGTAKRSTIGRAFLALLAKMIFKPIPHHIPCRDGGRKNRIAILRAVAVNGQHAHTPLNGPLTERLISQLHERQVRCVIRKQDLKGHIALAKQHGCGRVDIIAKFHAISFLKAAKMKTRDKAPGARTWQVAYSSPSAW